MPHLFLLVQGDGGFKGGPVRSPIFERTATAKKIIHKKGTWLLPDRYREFRLDEIKLTRFTIKCSVN